MKNKEKEPFNPYFEGLKLSLSQAIAFKNGDKSAAAVVRREESK